MKKATTTQVKVISYPQEIYNGYDIIVYPGCIGGGFVTAMVYATGTRKAVWETVQHDTPKDAIKDAKNWINGTH